MDTIVCCLLITWVICASALETPPPERLTVNVLDGEVLVLWKRPAEASHTSYNVQMSPYTGHWAEVRSCTGITRTYCDLTSLIDDYSAAYKVRVQAVAHGDESTWTVKKFLPNASDLQPPSFTLWATSSSITVIVHQKRILRELFPYGVTYTVHLEEPGRDHQHTVAYLDDDVMDAQTTKTFSSLRYGVEYCVSVSVQGNGALSKSSASPPQCLRLPEREWFIVAVSSLATVGLLAAVAFTVVLLLCFLRRPERTPDVLKSPALGWHPLPVEEGPVEVVTDRGWFLSNYRAQVPEAEDRRTSLDSGFSTESGSAAKKDGHAPTRQEDSGCGSMGGTESPAGSQTVYPLQDHGVDAGGGAHGKERVTGSVYQSQSPSPEHALTCVGGGEGLRQVRAGGGSERPSCVCSGAARRSGGRTEPSADTCTGNEGLSRTRGFLHSYDEQQTFSSYSRKIQVDPVMTGDLETTFPLLASLSAGMTVNFSGVPLSLCDVQLEAD